MILGAAGRDSGIGRYEMTLREGGVVELYRLDNVSEILSNG